MCNRKSSPNKKGSNNKGANNKSSNNKGKDKQVLTGIDQKLPIQYEFSKEELIEMQTEAFYRAFKRVEDEKKQEQQSPEKKENKLSFKDKVCIVLSLLRFILFPFSEPKTIKAKDDQIVAIYLKQFTIIILFLIGAVSYACAWILIASLIINFIPSVDLITKIGFIVVCFFVSTMNFITGFSVSRLSDESSLYGFSASIFAMFALIIATLTLVLG